MASSKWDKKDREMKKIGKSSQVKATWRGRKAGVTEKNGSAVQSLKMKMISLILKVGGSLREEQFAKQWGENNSLLLVGGRHKQITMITQAGDDSLTRIWIYLPRMYMLTLLSTCNWTWRKHIVYRACFRIRQFRKRIWTMLKHFKIWYTTSAFPSGRCFKKETTAILHSTRPQSLISMSGGERQTLSTSYSDMTQAALRAVWMIVVFNNWRNGIRLSNYCCDFSLT